MCNLADEILGLRMHRRFWHFFCLQHLFLFPNLVTVLCDIRPHWPMFANQPNIVLWWRINVQVEKLGYVGMYCKNMQCIYIKFT